MSFILRCTEKLRRRLGIRVPTEDATPTTTALGDWYANPVTLHRRPLVVLISARTLLPIIVPLGPSSSLTPRFLAALEEMLLAIGVSDAQVRAELHEMRSVAFGRTQSRAVLGSMNDFGYLLAAVPRDETLLGAALGLADAPCRPIHMESPKRATLQLFDATVH